MNTDGIINGSIHLNGPKHCIPFRTVTVIQQLQMHRSDIRVAIAANTRHGLPDIDHRVIGWDPDVAHKLYPASTTEHERHHRTEYCSILLLTVMC